MTFVRLVLAISLDGRIAFSSRGPSFLGGEGDRKVLEQSLAWSDCVLIGAGTLRAHESTCLIKSSNLIKQRLLQGRSEQPICIVVSTKKDHCPSWNFFRQPIQRWLLTIPDHSSSANNVPGGYERQIFLQDQWSETIGTLNKEGLSKVVVLGGANLVFTLLLEDIIDELQLTIVPRILGGNHPWVLTSLKSFLPKIISAQQAWDLKGVEKLGSSEVMLRYQRKR